jgi:hypothetical protein
MPTQNLIPTFKGDTRQNPDETYSVKGYDVNAQGAPVYAKAGYYTPGVSLYPVTPTQDTSTMRNPQGFTIAEMQAQAEQNAAQQHKDENAKTIADIYGQAAGNQSELDAAYAAQRSLLEQQMQPVNEEDIRRQSIEKFQSEIDALNQFYTAKKAQALAALEPAQKARTGSSTAILARRGLLGSDFGASQAQQVMAGNEREKLQTAQIIDTEQQAQIASLMGMARQSAESEIAAKKAARESSTKELVSFLEGQKTRAEKAAQTTMSQFANLGTEPDEEQYKELARLYKTTVSALKSQYSSLAQGIEAEKVKAQTEAEKAKIGAQRTVSPGQSVIDEQGNVIFTAPASEKETLRTLSPGQTVIDNAGNVIYSVPKEAPERATPQSYQEWQLAGGESGTGKSYSNWLETKKSTTISAPKQYQYTAANYASRMNQGADIINNLEGYITSQNPLSFAAKKKLPDIAKPDQLKQLEQAQRNFLNAVLRRESGAVISPSEFEEGAKQYFPQPNDSAALLKQKKANRDLVIRNMKKEAGPAYEDVTGNINDTTGPSQEEKDFLKELHPDWNDADINSALGFNNDLSMSGNGSTVDMSKSLGLGKKNNNPGNLRYVGQKGAIEGAGGFAKFSTPEAGFMALLNQVSLDAKRGHTIETFINKYAPLNENDTELYIKQLSEAIGADRNTPISQLDSKQIARFIAKKESNTNIG